jgi:ribA/ribD-fused uncharacterized protein
MELFHRITRFSGAYHFLSNFYPQPIRYNEREYATSEHAYQAAKAASQVDHDLIANAATASLTKKLGRKIKLREDWEQVKLDVMYDILVCKFAPGTECASLLDSTGDSLLVEGNYWGDRFWGVCNGTGENWLGKILMRIRTENRNLPAEL